MLARAHLDTRAIGVETPRMGRRYFILDVFADRPLAGNPLAVVVDAEGLDTAAMQAVAREFALSETIFLAAPRDPVHLASARIFTPSLELPFAGHPTIGGAIVAAMLEAPDLMAAQEVDLVLEEAIGPVRCTVRQRRGEPPHARFEAPRLAAACGAAPDTPALAARLGLAPEDIGWGRHGPSRYGAGNAFVFVPVATLDALARARLAPGGEPEAFYLFTPGEAGTLRSRMLAEGIGVAEDPGTGSAVVALAGALLAGEGLADGSHDRRILQGVEMGRPSRIGLAFDVRDGRLVETIVGGSAVVVAEGTLRL